MKQVFEKGAAHLGAIVRSFGRKLNCSFTGHRDADGKYHSSYKFGTEISGRNWKEEVLCHYCGELYKRPASQERVDAFYGSLPKKA